MQRRIVVLLASVVGATVLMSGCGSGNSESEAPTKAEFVKEAETVCKKGLKERSDSLKDAIEKALERPEKGSQIAAQERLATDVALPPLRTMDTELEDIDAPSGSEEQVEAIVNALDAALDKAEADPLSLLDEYEQLFSESNRLAREYGLKACARV